MSGFIEEQNIHLCSCPCLQCTKLILIPFDSVALGCEGASYHSCLYPLSDRTLQSTLGWHRMPTQGSPEPSQRQELFLVQFWHSMCLCINTVAWEHRQPYAVRINESVAHRHPHAIQIHEFLTSGCFTAGIGQVVVALLHKPDLFTPPPLHCTQLDHSVALESRMTQGKRQAGSCYLTQCVVTKNKAWSFQEGMKRWGEIIYYIIKSGSHFHPPWYLERRVGS